VQSPSAFGRKGAKFGAADLCLRPQIRFPLTWGPVCQLWVGRRGRVQPPSAFGRKGAKFGTADILFASSNSIPPYLRATESTPFRQPTVSATTANLAELRFDPRHQCLPRSKWGRKIVRRPRRAQSDCPTTGDRGAALTLVRLE